MTFSLAALKPSWSKALRLHPYAKRRYLRNTAAYLTGVIISGVGGLAVGLAVQEILPLDFTAIGITYALSVLAAVVGTYMVLVELLLIARVPALERALGQDRLVTWHKILGPWSVWLILSHIVLIVTNYALVEGSNPIAELVSLITTTPWILPAVAGVTLMIVAGITSWKRVRGTLRREVWWTIHLYFYLAVALAFAHQIAVGGPFLSGWERWFWVGLYVVVFGLILTFRVVVPIVKNRRTQMVVERVVQETDNVVSVVLRGRNIARLQIEPGQFMNWRFDTDGLRYEAHPYSISAIEPAPASAATHDSATGTIDPESRLRITVKDLGDSSRALATLQPGTRAWFEGPYGASTSARISGKRVVLVAGGVGISPIVALADELAGEVPLDVVYRASTAHDLALTRELADLSRLGARIHLMPGPRHDYPMNARHLYETVGDLSDADLYVCGPASLNETVIRSAEVLGVRPHRIHREEFQL